MIASNMSILISYGRPEMVRQIEMIRGIPKVVNDGCVKIRFDSCSNEVSGIFALSPLSKFNPVLGPIVFVKLGFPDSV